MLNFNLWNFVSKHTYDSPENQINLLISSIKNIKSLKNNNNILDIGGGLVDRGSQINDLGSRTVLDIIPGFNVDVVGDAHNLPFKKDSFEIVTAFMVLEHLYNPILAIEECQRVLKPKGLLMLTTVQYWHNHGHPNDYYRYTKEGLKYICQNAGLRILKMWSMGGPALILFHTIELNLPPILRKFFLVTCPIFNYFDKRLYNHGMAKGCVDSLGWSFIAQKITSKRNASARIVNTKIR